MEDQHKGICAYKSGYEIVLVHRIIELAKAYGRHGYRNIMTLLEREGWHVNYKRIERIWRQEELKMPAKQCQVVDVCGSTMDLVSDVV